MNHLKNDWEGGNLEENILSFKGRGLKILSAKIQELVLNKQKTTYKDVANELIEQLRKSKGRNNWDAIEMKLSEIDENKEC